MKSLMQATKLLRTNSFAVLAVRNAGAWNKDWKPGPYPKTEEERIAAAKKYGLHPKDYQPYPDDGTGHGDYPMFEPVSMLSRDQFEHYDYPEECRNWQEIIHVDSDMYTGDKVDVTKKFRIPAHKQVVSFLIGVMLWFVILNWDYDNNKVIWPLMPQQFPSPDKKHYSFEPSH